LKIKRKDVSEGSSPHHNVSQASNFPLPDEDIYDDTFTVNQEIQANAESNDEVYDDVAHADNNSGIVFFQNICVLKMWKIKTNKFSSSF